MKSLSTIQKIIIYAILIGLAAHFIPPSVNWSPSFSKDHDWPFGSKILYELLPVIFPDQSVRVNDRSLYERRDSMSNQDAHMIFIQSHFTMDSLDVHVLLDHISRGNDAFISAQYFTPYLLDTLGYDQAYQWTTSSLLPGQDTSSKVAFNFLHEELRADSNYHFTTEYDLNYLVTQDSLEKPTALGWAIADSITVMVKEPIGLGNLILHTNPFIFSNYYLLDAPGRDYIMKVFSLMSDQNIIWDEYYNEYGAVHRNTDVLQVIRGYPTLLYAFYMSIIGTLLYLLFMSKRKQRIIPLIDQYPNESKDLIETLGSLYFNTSSNAFMAHKKIDIFYQGAYRSIGLKKTIPINEQVKIIVNKTSMSEDQAEQLVRLLSNLLAQKEVSVTQLKNLQKSTNQFKNHL